MSLVREFLKIFSDTNFNLIQAYFVAFNGNKLQNNLKKELGVIKADKLIKILNSFTGRFDLLWKKEEARLIKIKKYLNSQSKNIRLNLEIIDKLAEVKKVSVNSQQIPIHLVLSSKQQKDQVGWFSVFGKNADLVLECSGVSEKFQPFLNLIILHEHFHLALRKNSQMKKMIDDISVKNSKILELLSQYLSPAQILEELLISSFIPEGYLATLATGQKIKSVNSIKNNSNRVNFVSTRQFCAYKLRALSKDYIESEKSLDQEYLNSVIVTIKNR
ncbi:hypothetical protein BK005_00690 [bacterium CG10_37_50]|nr:MAG: hypothetical protein BK005_00690 [bacterium CG10_37_50]